MFWEVALGPDAHRRDLLLLMAARLCTQMLTPPACLTPSANGCNRRGSALCRLTGYLIVILIMGARLGPIMLILLPFVLPVMDTFHEPHLSASSR